jgi:hypothetical protein
MNAASMKGTRDAVRLLLGLSLVLTRGGLSPAARRS